MQYNSYTQPQRIGGYNSTAYGGYGTAGDGSSTKTNSNSLGVSAKTTQFQNDLGTLWSKYGWQLMGENKPKATDPNVEMGRTAVQQKKEVLKKKYIEYLTGAASQSDNWGVQKTIKDGAQPKQPVTNPKTVGPNAELGKTFASVSVPDEYSSKELVRRWINRLSDNKGSGRESIDTVKTAKDTTVYPTYLGLNAETARINYLDSTGKNAVEKIIEEKVSDKEMNLAYGDKDIVTKDNIYTQKPEKISENYKTVYNNIQPEYLKKKRRLEELEFYSKMGILNDHQKEELKKVQIDVDNLEHIKKKTLIGAKLQYEFLDKGIEKLSKMSVDDILNLKDKDDSIPYFSSVAQSARSTNQVIRNVKDAVGIVDSIKVEFNKQTKQFNVFNTKETHNSFSFKIADIKSEKGYYETKIIVDKNKTDYSDLIIKDLCDSLDNLTVSDSTKNTLICLADNNAISNFSKGLGTAAGFLDLVDLGVVLASDLSDEGQAGDDFAGELFGTAGVWAGDYAGGIAGAKAGTAIGMLLGPVGAVIGGALGAFAGAYILSSVMEDIGRYVGESMNDSEYTIEQYHQRAK